MPRNPAPQSERAVADMERSFSNKSARYAKCILVQGLESAQQFELNFKFRSCSSFVADRLRHRLKSDSTVFAHAAGHAQWRHANAA
jgi:hypothetical protein